MFLSDILKINAFKEEVMKKYKSILLSVLLPGILPAHAADVVGGDDKKVSVSVGAEIVSSYVWRGTYQTGASIQPYLSVDAFGFSLGAWGSTPFAGLADASKEFDLSLFYGYRGLSVGLTDYWWTGEGNAYFSAWKEETALTGNCHYLEGSVSYAFEESLSFPLSVGWNTIFYCPFDKTSEGKQRFSSYFDVTYGFSVKQINCSAGIGFSPWTGIYGDNFQVMDVTLKAARTVSFGNAFETELSVAAIFAPANDDAFLVFGILF